MKVWIKMAVIMFVLSLSVVRQDVYAAEPDAVVNVTKDVTKAAYVDTEQKGLFLWFEHFSAKKNYSYTISSGGTIISEGTAKNKMLYPLKPYKANTSYELSIKSTDNKVLTVSYYTGDTVTGYKVTDSAQKMKHTWKVTKKGSYDGYYLYIFEGDSIKPLLKTKVSGGNTSSKEVSVPDSMKSGSYIARLIAYKMVGKKESLGKGQDYSFTYVKTPARVKGLEASGNTKSAVLSWAPVPNASYYCVYKKQPSSSKYKLALKKVKTTSCTVTGLKPGKKYDFKVQAVTKYKSKTKKGEQSSAKSVTIPVVAGKVTQVKCSIDSDDTLYLKWKKTSHASGYTVYYKKHSKKNYKKLGTTKKTKLNLKKLKDNDQYDIIVCAFTKKGTKTYESDTPSDVVHVNPVRDVNKILASKVRTIGYVGRSREVYTTKKYSTKVKTAFVNYKGYKSSTKYLIWVSQYTQQVSVFQGSRGKWKMIRSFTIATGTARNHSPRGVFKVGKKEYSWNYVNTQILYVTHYYLGNAFHSRPLYYGGGVATSTIGRPVSHGCFRCYTEDAKYIYYNMPAGTTVVSY